MIISWHLSESCQFPWHFHVFQTSDCYLEHFPTLEVQVQCTVSKLNRATLDNEMTLSFRKGKTAETIQYSCLSCKHNTTYSLLTTSLRSLDATSRCITSTILRRIARTCVVCAYAVFLTWFCRRWVNPIQNSLSRNPSVVFTSTWASIIVCHCKQSSAVVQLERQLSGSAAGPWQSIDIRFALRSNHRTQCSIAVGWDWSGATIIISGSSPSGAMFTYHVTHPLAVRVTIINKQVGRVSASKISQTSAACSS